MALRPLHIKVTTAGGVATIEIARPEKRNALSLAMYEAMTQALIAAAADDAVRAVIITGQPGVFAAGNDLEDFLAAPPDTENSPVLQFIRALLSFEKPVVAAVTGTAIGIGVTMLLHCDLVYLSSDAKLSMPFVSLGLVPESGASLLIPRLMGHVKAAEKLMLGTPFTAAEAVDLGIANAALPPENVLSHARAAAERFNNLPAAAVRDTKRLMRAGLRAAVEHAVREETEAFVERLRSPEAREALAAFFQRRKAGSASAG
ncbi:MAG: enoyl-CoA hydratase [Gammaproteobacteria bacterium]